MVQWKNGSLAFKTSPPFSTEPWLPELRKLRKFENLNHWRKAFVNCMIMTFPAIIGCACLFVSGKVSQLSSLPKKLHLDMAKDIMRCPSAFWHRAMEVKLPESNLPMNHSTSTGSRQPKKVGRIRMGKINSQRHPTKNMLKKMWNFGNGWKHGGLFGWGKCQPKICWDWKTNFEKKIQPKSANDSLTFTRNILTETIPEL